MDKCPYCGLRLCGMMSGSTVCEPDLYRSGVYTPEEIEILRSEWGGDVAKIAETHNASVTKKGE